MCCLQDVYFDKFFDADSLFCFSDMSEIDSSLLMSMLNDIVQVLATEDNIEFTSNNRAHRAFRLISLEIAERLSK